MSAYYWEHIKSCSWFSYPIYVNLAILLHINSSISSHVQYWWNYKFIPSFWYRSLWYLLLFSNHPNYLLSLVDICDVFWHISGWSSSIYNKINWAFGHALKAKILLVYCMTSFWISCSILSIYFVCTCFVVIIIFVMVSI
jgi:hypothetical protein